MAGWLEPTTFMSSCTGCELDAMGIEMQEGGRRSVEMDLFFAAWGCYRYTEALYRFHLCYRHG